MIRFTMLLVLSLGFAVIIAQPPASFDLRDFNGNNYVTSVKSQQGGTCWTHGTMASMEGNLLMTGNWAAAGETGEPNLAEYHLDWWNGYNDYYNADLNPPLNNGQGLEVHQGGDYRVSTAYISRGDGCVRDIDAQSYNNAPSFFEPEYHKYYPMHVEWYTLGENFENMDLIKTMIMEKGAMATCMCYSSSFINGEYEHYQPVSSTQEPNHSVTIIGWDNNRVVQGAPGNGAWLVKNSWGSGWGDGGYFWISYYDKHACQNPEMGAVSFQEVVPMPYDNVYYHDYHGWRDTLTTADEVFNKYIASANETASAVSFFTAGENIIYDVVIYDDFIGGVLSNELSSVNGIMEYSGLHTIPLAQPVDLTLGDDFYVCLYLSEGGIPYDRTSDVPVLLGGGSKTIVTSAAEEDQSYYWSDTKGWVDFYNYDDPSGFQHSGNFCIKVLTQTVYALDMGQIEILDPTGNNNGFADPGETFDLVISMTNGGLYDVTNAFGTLDISDPYVSVNVTELNFGTIQAGETVEATVTATASGTTPLGHVVEAMVLVDCNSNGNTFNYDYDFSFKVGRIVEDFESGDFSSYDWTFDGNADWEITTSNPFEGTYSAKSGAISNQSESELILTLEVENDDVISFFRKVSSEADYDYLRFYIDDTMIDEWAGEEGWEEVTYEVSAGTHTFKWSYEKDYSVANGDDCGWVDFISLPISGEGFPVIFDLRNYNGEDYVSSVKSQTSGTCWTHGTMAAIEGNLIMNGNWENQQQDPEPNLAEYHLDWWDGFNEYYNQDVSPPFNNGQGLEVHQGGDYRVATAYMSRGEGMVYSPDANDDTELDDNWFQTAPSRFDTSYSLYYSRDVEWFVMGENLENIGMIKERLMTEGVVATCMCYTNGFINSEYEHYQPMSSTFDPNHSVAIIGWDDDREIAGTPGNGAWLVKNSWGSNWGNDGYFWISYYDKHAGQHPEMGAVSFINSEPFPYNYVYYHDYHGWRDTKPNTTEVINAFEMKGDQYLEAVSFFTAVHNVNYVVKIYDDFDGSELSNELASLSGHIDYSGLHAVELDEPFMLGYGNDFYVYLYLSEGGMPYDRTSIVPVLLCGNSSKSEVPSKAETGQSYYMEDDEWKDFYDYDDPSGYQNTGNFCVKVMATGDVYVGLDMGLTVPKHFDCEAYPNPFADETTISYDLTETSTVKISIKNITGQEVISFEPGEQQAGRHEISWRGTKRGGSYVEPGVYFYSIWLNDQLMLTKRMLKIN
ncbi:MAG: T9SS type A sorting domain-containing protein [Bacteroidales bacterium]|nr:T9SS type A sorting domain-containing protein [Bacteroidales bacterium]